jgi:hypothetical protein
LGLNFGKRVPAQIPAGQIQFGGKLSFGSDMTNGIFPCKGGWHMALPERAQNARPPGSVILTSIVLSVFIRVHPWFRFFGCGVPHCAFCAVWRLSAGISPQIFA